MKIVPQLNRRNPDARRNLSHAGMTLVELMVAMGLFGFVSVGLLYTHVFCLRQDELVNSKLGASDQSRKGFSLLTRDIRAAKVWEVGNVNSAGTNFTGIDEGTVQKGNALRLSYSTNWNEGLLYYFNTNNLVDGGKLYRIKLTTGESTLIADYLTNRTANALMFQAENYKGRAADQPHAQRRCEGHAGVCPEPISPYQGGTGLPVRLLQDGFQTHLSRSRRPMKTYLKLTSRNFVSHRTAGSAGFAQGGILFMVLIMVGVSLVILSATMRRTGTVAILNDRNNQHAVDLNAAEAAVEKAVARMSYDFQTYGIGYLNANLPLYRSYVPNANENSFWSNFEFSDGQGSVGSNYVAKIADYSGPLPSQYPGRTCINSPVYRVLSNVRDPNGRNPDVTAAVQVDVLAALCRLRNGRSSTTGCWSSAPARPMTVQRGAVHANGKRLQDRQLIEIDHQRHRHHHGTQSSPANNGSSSSWTYKRVLTHPEEIRKRAHHQPGHRHEHGQRAYDH